MVIRMKYFLCGLFTIILGYILSSLFSGIGVDSVEMTYINSIMISVIFLSGVVSFWGYIIFDKNEFNKSYREFIEEEYSLEM